MASDNRVPDWMLERLAHGDLSKDERARVQRRVEEDATAPSRLREIERSDRELGETLPSLRRIEQRAERARPERRDWRLPLLVPALATAAVVAVVMVRGGDGAVPDAPGAGETGEEVTRIKGPGGSRLLLHRQRGGASELFGPRPEARPGEVVQISYLADPKTYGVILSIDGRGGVTLHYPESPTGSTALAAKGILPSAYELDDAPEFERFVLVTSKEPVAVDRVLEAARLLAGDRALARDAKLPLPSELSQSSLVVRKLSP